MPIVREPKKDMLAIAAGAGLGVVLPTVLKKYYDVPVPVIGQYIPAPWNRTSVFIPVVAGGGSLAASFFAPKGTVQSFLFVFGITSLIAGVISALLPSASSAPRAAMPVRRSFAPPTVLKAGCGCKQGAVNSTFQGSPVKTFLNGVESVTFHSDQVILA
ncbi:MAG: hypothetical protein NT038_03585 [Euryarchaeota archaeon]|nr:hypothetical protein [Euryarchaeota archaeon]